MFAAKIPDAPRPASRITLRRGPSSAIYRCITSLTQYATYVSYHEKFYGRREKLCFAPRVRGALFAWLQDRTWVQSFYREYEKCYGTVTIRLVSSRPIGRQTSSIGPHRRPPLHCRPSPRC